MGAPLAVGINRQERVLCGSWIPPVPGRRHAKAVFSRHCWVLRCTSGALVVLGWPPVPRVYLLVGLAFSDLRRMVVPEISFFVRGTKGTPTLGDRPTGEGGFDIGLDLRLRIDASEPNWILAVVVH